MKAFNRNYLFPCVDSSNFLRACKCVRWSFRIQENRVRLGFRFSLRLQPSQQEAAVGDILPDWEITLSGKQGEKLTGEWLGDLLVVRNGRHEVAAEVAAVNHMLLIRTRVSLSLQALREGITTGYEGGAQLWIKAGKYSAVVSRFQESTPVPWIEKDHTWHADLSRQAATLAVALRFGPFDDPEYYMRLVPADILAVVKKNAEDWSAASPTAAMGGRSLEKLFKHHWVLHRTRVLEPEGSWRNRWLHEGWFLPVSFHWDFVHCMLDHVWKDAALCSRQVEDFFAQSPESSGFMGHDACLIDAATLQVTYHKNYPTENDISYPPLWTQAVIKTYQWTEDKERLRRCYALCAKKARWWEKYRRTSDGWFFYKNLGETGYDNMPRAYPEVIDSTSKSIEHLAAVDLNPQMVMYYRDLSWMADELGMQKDAVACQKQAEALSARIRQGLWSEKDGCFYDLDMRNGKLTFIQSQASFWSLAAGVASKEQAARLHALIKNPKKFWTYFPIPSIPIDSKYFSLDLWRGPAWVSQNYWFARGLKTYGFRKTAAELVLKTLKGAASIVKKEGVVLEYYNPLKADTDALLRKGSIIGPIIYYLGHNPFAALFYEVLLGLQPTKNGFLIDPLWEGITGPIKATFNYENAPVALRLEPKFNKISARYKGNSVLAKNNTIEIFKNANKLRGAVT